MTGRRRDLLLVASACLAAALLASGDVPLPKRGGGARPVPRGWIVFDSNREGQFDIFKMRGDGSSLTRLTDHPDWDLYPDWSPDGRLIVFARHRPGDERGQGEILVMVAAGTGERVVAERGTFPQFTPDGTAVIFERDRKQVVRAGLDPGRERRIFPPPGSGSFPGAVVKPRLSPDGGRIIFTTDRGGGWNVWSADLEGRTRRLAKGCEGTWGADGSIYWVSGGQWTGTAMMTASADGSSPRRLPSPEGLYRHVYFPTPAGDGGYLLFSACPSGQHHHFSANYQVFAAPLDGGVPVRLAENGYTERWPRLQPERTLD